MPKFNSLYVIEDDIEDCTEEMLKLLQENTNCIVLKHTGNGSHTACYIEEGVVIQVNLKLDEETDRDDLISTFDALNISKKRSEDSHLIKKIELILKNSIKREHEFINRKFQLQWYELRIGSPEATPEPNIMYITYDEAKKGLHYTTINKSPSKNKQIEEGTISLDELKGFNYHEPLTIEQLDSIKEKILEITFNRRQTIKQMPIMDWNKIFLMSCHDLNLLISAYNLIFMLLKDKKHPPEFLKRNGLPENLEDMSDQIMNSINELIKQDGSLLQKISYNVGLPDALVNLLLKKICVDDSAQYKILMTSKILPKELEMQMSQFALKCHTDNNLGRRINKKEYNSPKECIVGLNQGVFPSATSIQIVDGKMFDAGVSRTDGIGYALFLPENYSTPKAIMVWVYGGKHINECNFLNLRLSDLDLDLLEQGIAIAYLNTPERNYYPGLHSTQLEITPEGQQANNQTITAFIRQLRENPGHFHDKCHVLKDTPIYLTGFSFGGSVVFRYSQLNEKNLIDGFISINGAVSFNKLKKHERQPMKKRWTTTANQAITWLSPEESICKKESEKPGLIVQNIKDTNANVFNAISFFNKSKKQQINGVQIFLFEEDTSVTSNSMDHDIPSNSKPSFPALANAITCFILKKNFEPGQSIDETKIKMARYNNGKSLASRFVSHVYHYYPEDFRLSSLNDLNVKKYDSLLAGIYYANRVYNSNDNSLQDTMKNLGNAAFQDPENSILLRKYLASCLYYSISRSNKLSFLIEDKNELQRTVDMALDSPEVQKCFWALCSDIEFIKKGNFLHIMENLYICCPSLIPEAIYEEKEFIEFKEKAYHKLGDSLHKVDFEESISNPQI